MKLNITEELNFKITKFEDIKTVSKLLKDFRISHKIKDDFIFIETQKVVLNEIDMNKLFSKIFYFFEIEYSNIGYTESEFTLNVKLLD